MQRISQAQLNQNIELIRWSMNQPKPNNLLTVHSLLLDNNPRFVELKQLVQNHNLSSQKSASNRLKQTFIDQLYAMLCDMVRIPNYENQLEYLNKVYKWVENDSSNLDDAGSSTTKIRPTTASTRSRPFSAYVKPSSGSNRPGTSKPAAKAQIEQMEIHAKMNREKTNIDYQRLKHGEKEFFGGYRTLHEEYEKPKKRLKQFQRKIFYDEDLDSDVEQPEPKEIEELKQIPFSGEGQLIEGELPEEAEADVNLENGDDAGEAFVNVDDIPIEGDEECKEEENEVLDKLKPKNKAFAAVKRGEISENHRGLNRGNNKFLEQREYKQSKANEELEMVRLQFEWAGERSKIKSQIKRRAESARMGLRRSKGKLPVADPSTMPQNQNVIFFDSVQPTVVNAKGSRPITAFNTKRNNEEIIHRAFITSRLELKNPMTVTGTTDTNCLTTVAPPPKKKTFAEILQMAEERVEREAAEEVLAVKEIFAKNKLSLGANRIARSITYYQKELPDSDQFVGQITGMAMVKNPFIKIAKKKKKKTKKK